MFHDRQTKRFQSNFFYSIDKPSQRLRMVEEMAEDTNDFITLVYIQPVVLQSHWKQSFVLMLIQQLSRTPIFSVQAMLSDHQICLEEKQSNQLIFAETVPGGEGFPRQYVHYRTEIAATTQNRQLKVQHLLIYQFKKKCQQVHALINRLIGKYFLQNKIEYWRKRFHQQLLIIAQSVHAQLPLSKCQEDENHMPNNPVQKNDLTSQ